MNPRAHELISEMQKLQADTVIDAGRNQTRQTPLLAELMVIIAESQEKSAETLERYTRKIVALTWALVGLTVALLIITICVEIRH